MMVSVIIGVYNREKYLRQCVESVLCQTLRDLEVICVDDVSTDGSLQLLYELAATDPRVKVLEQKENGGAQLARNAGVAVSKGDFIAILDDDDWLAPDALELAVKEFEGRDDVQCVLLRELRVRPDGTVFEPSDRFAFREASGEEIYYHSMPWHVSGRYVVRRELQLRIPFDNSDRIYGDDNTALLHFLNSPRIIQSEGIYYYRLLDNSLTHNMNMGVFWGLKAHEAMSQYLASGSYSHAARVAHERFRWIMLVNALRHYYMYHRHYNRDQREEAMNLMRHDRETMDFTIVPREATRKFGYIPMMSLGWRPFVWQVYTYLFMRRICGRL